jgi:hypothetical protein
VNYFVVPGVIGVVVELPLPLVPVEPPLEPVVPDELLPAPVLPVPEVLAPAPVLALPRSCRHLSFADWSVSCSHLAFAEALSVVPDDTPELEDVDGEDEEPALEDGVDEVDGVALGVDGELALPVLLLPEVWATATLVAARNAAATAACRIFIVIDSSSTVGMDAPKGGRGLGSNGRARQALFFSSASST